MGSMDFGNATTSDYTAVDDVTVDSKTTDGATGGKETTYINSDWAQQWGYFNAIPDLKAAITLKAMWLMGKGFTTDKITQARLDNIRGWGKETFYDILFNMDIISRVGGDSYAEIIRNDKGTLVNLKVLNTGSIKIVVDSKGIIKRYEQISNDPKSKVIKKFKPHEIFHISNYRLADQIHGISDIVALEETIKANNESFVDTKSIMHHQAKPFILWKIKSDNQTKINALVSKIDSLRNLGEDLFIPDDEDILSYEVIQANPSNAVFMWRDDIRNKFYRNIMMPQIVPGAAGGSTESESKVIYTAHEQIVSYMQLQREKQIWQQLQIRLKFNSPISMSGALSADEAKDANSLTPQPSDTKVTPVGNI